MYQTLEGRLVERILLTWLRDARIREPNIHLFVNDAPPPPSL